VAGGRASGRHGQSEDQAGECQSPTAEGKVFHKTKILHELGETLYKRANKNAAHNKTKLEELCFGLCAKHQPRGLSGLLRLGH
jgi:hypothetical protein